jgi:hypothetical protein
MTEALKKILHSFLKVTTSMMYLSMLLYIILGPSLSTLYNLLLSMWLENNYNLIIKKYI